MIRITIEAKRLRKGDTFRDPFTGEVLIVAEHPFTHPQSGNQGFITSLGTKYFDPNRRVEILFPADLNELALKAFGGDSKRALQWMTSPNGALDGYTPQQKACTEEGLRQIRQILNAIIFGSAC